MTKSKITKKVLFNAVKAIAQGVDHVEVGEFTVTGEDLVAFADKNIEQLEKKAAAAKEKAAKAKIAGDELREKIEEVLTDEYQTIPEILAQLGDEELTSAKIAARISQLVKLDKAHKTSVKTADGRKINGYAAGPAPAEVEDAE